MNDLSIMNNHNVHIIPNFTQHLLVHYYVCVCVCIIYKEALKQFEELNDILFC